MRLIQHVPAWHIHAFLRFLGLGYTSEYVPSTVALGFELPVLVDGNSVTSCGSIMDYLLAGYGTGSVSTPVSADAVACTYLKIKLLTGFEQYKRASGFEDKSLNATLPVGMNWLVVYTRKLRSALVPASNSIEVADAQALIHYLDRTYQHLNDVISQYYAQSVGGHIVSVSKIFSNSALETPRDSHGEDGFSGHTSQVQQKQQQLNTRQPQGRREQEPNQQPSQPWNPGMADALLFGHLVDALCMEQLAPVVTQYSSLMDFFESVCTAYFARTTDNMWSREDPLLWNATLAHTLRTPVMCGQHCDWVKHLLQRGPMEVHSLFPQGAPATPLRHKHQSQQGQQWQQMQKGRQDPVSSAIRDSSSALAHDDSDSTFYDISSSMSRSVGGGTGSGGGGGGVMHECLALTVHDEVPSWVCRVQVQLGATGKASMSQQQRIGGLLDWTFSQVQAPLRALSSLFDVGGVTSTTPHLKSADFVERSTDESEKDDDKDGSGGGGVKSTSVDAEGMPPSISRYHSAINSHTADSAALIVAANAQVPVTTRALRDPAMQQISPGGAVFLTLVAGCFTAYTYHIAREV